MRRRRAPHRDGRTTPVANRSTRIRLCKRAPSIWIGPRAGRRKKILFHPERSSAHCTGPVSLGATHLLLGRPFASGLQLFGFVCSICLHSGAAAAADAAVTEGDSPDEVDAGGVGVVAGESAGALV
jgi:hypothetical protein